MSNRASLTVAIMKYGNLDALEEQLKNLVIVYENLPEQLKTNFDVLISDNNSGDGSQLVLENYSNLYPWISYVIQQSYISYDEHVLFLYNTAQGDYIWLCAVDDFIKSKESIQEVFNIVKDKSVAGVIVGISPDQSNLQNITKEILMDQAARLTLIVSSGKVSRHIIKNQRVQPTTTDSFVGIGYMHLTLQTLVQSLNKNLPLINIPASLVWSKQRPGSKNSYHPKFACEVVDSMKIKDVVEESPLFFKSRSSTIIIKSKFLIRNILYATTHCWHADYLCDFIYQLYRFRNRKNYNMIERIWLFLAILFLIRRPKLFGVAIKSLRGVEAEYSKSDYRL